MAKARGKSKTPRTRRSAAAAARSQTPSDLKLGTPPAAGNPEAQAEFFMEMLDAFAQQGSPEAKRLRSGLIEAVVEYRDAEDKQQALEELQAKLLGMEAGLAELVLRTTRKMRDRLVQESRKLGTTSKPGQVARTTAEGLSVLVQGLDTLLKAAAAGDQAMREDAYRLMGQARETMQVLTQG